MVGRPFVPKFFLDALLTGPPHVISERGARTMSERRIGIGMFFGGIILIAAGALIEKWTTIPSNWESEARTGIVALGTALAIAGLLALTVDPVLKKSIARAAFREVMGWVSPERLWSELESVYQERLFAIEHLMTVNLSETPNGYMRMTQDIQRTIINESPNRQEITPSLFVRDWKQPGRESGITEVSASFKGNRYAEREKVEHADEEATDMIGERLTAPINLAKDDKVTTFYKGYEDKLVSDMHWQVSLIPTQNPTVIVNHPDSLNVYVQFASTAEKEHEREVKTGSEVTSQWTLNGVMLPAQAIIIRWWPKDEDAKRNNE